MPAEASRTLRVFLVAGAAALVFGVVFAWSRPLFPLLAGFFLAYIAHPLASWFARHRLPRILGFVVVLLAFFGVAAVVLFVFLPAVVHELATAAAKLPTWQEVLHERLEPLLADAQKRYPEAFGVVSQKVTAYVQEKLPQLAPKLAGWLGQLLLSGLSLVSALLGLVVALVIGAYLTADFPKFLATLRQLVPRPVLPMAEVVALEVHQVLGAFFRGQLLVALGLAGMYTLGLWLVGAPLALVVGPLAGLLSLVPYLGLVVGAGLAVVLTLLEHQDLLHPLLAVAVFVVAQNVEGWVLTPKLVGKGVGLHPVWVLVALLLGGELFGITGVIVAVPVAAALRVVLVRALAAYRASALYQGEPVEVVFYTRPNCPLCQELGERLAPLSELYGLAVREIDVEGDPALLARYGDQVPVLEVAGTVVASGKTDGQELARKIREVLGGIRD